MSDLLIKQCHFCKRMVDLTERMNWIEEERNFRLWRLCFPLDSKYYHKLCFSIKYQIPVEKLK